MNFQSFSMFNQIELVYYYDIIVYYYMITLIEHRKLFKINFKKLIM